MNFAINPLLSGVGEPPIAEAISWISGRTFPKEKPLVDLSQAAPGYPPAHELTEHGGIIVHGRSDAVLNPGGVRIGTAEIYRQVEQLPEILESIVIGQDWQHDVRVVLFVRVRDGVKLDEALQNKIKAQIRNNTTPRHVPAKIVAVADIPRTKSGKITELAVRDTVHGKAVKNKDALANPEALDLYVDIADLKS